jgi:hypothetical protein
MLMPLRLFVRATALLLVATVALPAQATMAAPRARGTAREAGAPRDTGESALRAAASAQKRNLPIEFSATVVKLLKDDREGISHQRFLVKAAGLSILVAHNLDLAERAPVKVGDVVRLRGEYVWNNKGGVMHWTHHDPRGRHAAGFIEVGGQRVQ